VHINWDPPAVVGDFDPTLWGYINVDVVAMTSQCFVNRVVNNFINQVVKTSGTG
jgi:hypothetical protein